MEKRSYITTGAPNGTVFTFLGKTEIADSLVMKSGHLIRVVSALRLVRFYGTVRRWLIIQLKRRESIAALSR